MIRIKRFIEGSDQFDFKTNLIVNIQGAESEAKKFADKLGKYLLPGVENNVEADDRYN